MEMTFRKALEQRRSYYELSRAAAIDDKQIEEILHFAAKFVPSAFNSQSTRMVLLLHEAHTALWNDIVKETLRAMVPPAAFPKTEQKIDKSFAAGYGTVLFFEDTHVVEKLQKEFPTYAGNFTSWAEQTSAMHQLAVWTMLEESGMGASLQHYNPIIDDKVRQRWNLPDHWRLTAQMPFGMPLDKPAPKEFLPLENRIFTFDK
ncbi:MAG: nitroreductase family protein [Alistipes sp.]|nr:nitroreductase family protein [Alistipes sp.]